MLNRLVDQARDRGRVQQRRSKHAHLFPLLPVRHATRIFDAHTRLKQMGVSESYGIVQMRKLRDEKCSSSSAVRLILPVTMETIDSFAELAPRLL